MYKLFYQSIIYMVSFGKKMVHGFTTFGKKLNEQFGQNKLGRKVANTLKGGLNLVEGIAKTLPMNPVTGAVLAGTEAGKNMLSQVRKGTNQIAGNVRDAKNTAEGVYGNVKNELERAKARIGPVMQTFA